MSDKQKDETTDKSPVLEDESHKDRDIAPAEIEKLTASAEQSPRIKPVPSLSEQSTNAIESAENENKKEIGGRDGPDPTRYGDWEMNGRCIDF